ncbi:SpoIIE family protein phosphatase [Paenibacillus sp. Z3-2]
MSIIIVDDSNLNLSFIRDVLTKAGYCNIQTASSADQVFDLLGIADGNSPRKPAAVDLILLDIVMPIMDGITACKKIKEHAVYSDLPIIFLTGDRKHFKEAFNAGGMDFIEKGGPEYELLARVKSALRLKKEMDIRKTRDNRMQKELQLAKHLQNSVLSPSIMEHNIQIHGKYIQSEEVSGDMFYWTRIDEHRYGVLLIDVSGHGLSSALISMSVRSMMDEMVNRRVDPALVCDELNRQMIRLFTNSKLTVYFTAIYILIDLNVGEIYYFNAGHPPGLVLLENRETIQLKGTTIPIGIKTEIDSRIQTWKIQGETRILLYTDGLVEVPGHSIKDGISQLERYAKSLIHLDNDSFVDRIEEWVQHKTDDVCIISINLK